MKLYQLDTRNYGKKEQLQFIIQIKNSKYSSIYLGDWLCKTWRIDEYAVRVYNVNVERVHRFNFTYGENNENNDRIPF